MICHSFDDDVVPVEYGRQAWRLLSRMGFTVSYMENMAGVTEPKHWLAVPRCPNDIATFINLNLQSCPHYFGSTQTLEDEDGRVIPRPSPVWTEHSGLRARLEQVEHRGGEQGSGDDAPIQDGDGLGLEDGLPR